MSTWIKLGLGLMAIAADVAFTYFASPLVSTRRRLVVAGAATGPFFLAMPKLLTWYRESTFARTLFGPPPPPTIVHQAPPFPVRHRYSGTHRTENSSGPPAGSRVHPRDPSQTLRQVST